MILIVQSEFFLDLRKEKRVFQKTNEYSWVVCKDRIKLMIGLPYLEQCLVCDKTAITTQWNYCITVRVTEPKLPYGNSDEWIITLPMSKKYVAIELGDKLLILKI